MDAQAETSTDEASTTAPRGSKRSRKLIKGRLQLTLAGIFAGLSLLSLLLQTLLFAAILSNAADSMPIGGQYLLDLMPTLLGWSLLFSFGVVLPATVLVGILTTFRLAGPIYRFEQFLQAVIGGKQLGPCKIRKGDALSELCDLINEVTDPLRHPAGVDVPKDRGVGT